MRYLSITAKCSIFNFMVEYTTNLNFVFGSLADPTRRDILQRIAQKELSISEIAAAYTLTFAAISKHLMILEKAQLIRKRRQGKQLLVSPSAHTLADATKYLEQYTARMERRMDALEAIVS